MPTTSRPCDQRSPLLPGFTAAIELDQPGHHLLALRRAKGGRAGHHAAEVDGRCDGNRSRPLRRRPQVRVEPRSRLRGRRGIVFARITARSFSDSLQRSTSDSLPSKNVTVSACCRDDVQVGQDRAVVDHHDPVRRPASAPRRPFVELVVAAHCARPSSSPPRRLRGNAMAAACSPSCRERRCRCRPGQFVRRGPHRAPRKSERAEGDAADEHEARFVAFRNPRRGRPGASLSGPAIPAVSAYLPPAAVADPGGWAEAAGAALADPGWRCCRARLLSNSIDHAPSCPGKVARVRATVMVAARCGA